MEVLNSLMTLITGVLFFYIGKYSVTDKDTKIIDKIISNLSDKKKQIIKLKTPEEIWEDKKKSMAQKEVDEAMSTTLKEIL